MKLYRIVATLVLLVMVGLGAVAQMDDAPESGASAPTNNWNTSDMQGLKIN